MEERRHQHGDRSCRRHQPPGEGSSYPGRPVQVNNSIFFAANNGTTGGELWQFTPNSNPSVSLAISPTSLAESGGTQQIIATLDEVSILTTTINLSFSGTATHNTDYSAIAVSIVIPAGSLSGAVTLSAINDATFEGDESIVVDVPSDTNGTENGTQSVAATSKIDYSASSNTIVVLAGQTSASLTLTGINDITFEGSESIVVDIDSVTNGTENGVQQVTATFADDETQPNATLSLTGSPLVENGSSETRRRKLTVTPQNDAPTITLTGGSTSYVTGNSAVAIDGGATISDLDSTSLTRVVVTLTDAESGDVLSYTPRAGLSYSQVGNTLTIGGLASVSYYAGALQRVRFATTTVGDGTRTVNIAATDSSGVSGVPNVTTTVSKSLTVQSPLLLAESSVVASPVADTITAAQLQPLITEALARWESVGLGASQLAVLRSTVIEIRDLRDSRTLGLGGGSTIVLDDNAAGVGWFVDASPSTDDDVTSVDRVDLLTVIMHEYGHILGFDDETSSDESLMSESVSPGVRRVPTLAALNLYFERLG